VQRRRHKSLHICAHVILLCLPLLRCLSWGFLTMPQRKLQPSDTCMTAVECEGPCICPQSLLGAQRLVYSHLF
jgi:hypothetical protein